MKSFILTLLFLVAITKCTIADSQPMVFRYRDDDGYIRMGVLRKPEDRKPFSIVPTSSSDESSQQSESDDSEINIEDTSAYMHELSHFSGSHEEIESKETSKEDMHAEEKLAGVGDAASTENKKFNVYAKHPKQKLNLKPKKNLKNKKIYKDKSYKHKVPKHKPQKSEESRSSSEEVPPHHPPPHSSESVELPPPSKPPKHPEVSKTSCKGKKQVYVYKQPPIVVRPRPTNVVIRSKPIVVQPPPLVVHQAAPKPCNPVIKYQTPNIKIKPVIVKIRKPKPTPCHTTRRSCKKCERKPVRKCNRCHKKRCQCHHNHHGHIWT